MNMLTQEKPVAFLSASCFKGKVDCQAQYILCDIYSPHPHTRAYIHARARRPSFESETHATPPWMPPAALGEIVS
jgi:hypothetical protein